MTRKILSKISHVGIDYSLSSPSTVVIQGDTVFCLAYGNKKRQGVFSGAPFHVNIIEYPTFSSQQERYIKLASDTIKYIKTMTKDTKIEGIRIEGYSFNSTGQVFQLAENCGVLKHMLYTNGYQFDTLPPTSLKKYATEKGNANKIAMYEAFVKDNIDLKDLLGITLEGVGNPVSDIVDAYFLAKSLKDNYV
jgi:Holliday junction resolvasome RuvABC endonuclease subunit